jgi:hypothetical protein
MLVLHTKKVQHLDFICYGQQQLSVPLSNKVDQVYSPKERESDQNFDRLTFVI